MNTKTMRLPPRRVLTPSASSTIPSNKRKDRDDPFDRPKPVTSPTKLLKPDKPSHIISTSSGGSIKPSLEPSRSNQLLAGYLAHEYLTRGTLFGQPWVPPRAAESPTSTVPVADKRKGKLTGAGDAQEGEATAEEKRGERMERYVEVGGLLKGGGGVHLPGVVNPTQLARFLHL